jgi:hypothetical protein
MSEPTPVEIHMHAGGKGRFHIVGGGDQFDQRQGVMLDEGDVLFLKLDTQGRVWLEGAAGYDTPENREIMTLALRKTAEHIEQGGQLRSEDPSA